MVQERELKQFTLRPVIPPAPMFPTADVSRPRFLSAARAEGGGVRLPRFAREQGREWLDILVATLRTTRGHHTLRRGQYGRLTVLFRD